MKQKFVIFKAEYDFFQVGIQSDTWAKVEKVNVVENKGGVNAVQQVKAVRQVKVVNNVKGEQTEKIVLYQGR